MGEWEDLAEKGHPESGAFDRRQHVLRPVGTLLPCRDCGGSDVPLVHRPLRHGRRVVRCLGCGAFFIVAAMATDAEIEAAWNARVRTT